MRKLFYYLGQKIKGLEEYFGTHKKYFNYISKGLLITTGILYLLYVWFLAIESNSYWLFLRFGLVALTLSVFALVLSKILKRLANFPSLVVFSVVLTSPLLVLITEKSLFLSVVMFCLILIGSSLIYVLRERVFGTFSAKKRVLVSLLTVVFFISGGLLVAGFNLKGFDLPVQRNAAILSHAKIPHLRLESPAKIGSFDVMSLTYGSGKDKHRPEYGALAQIKTASFDCSDFIDKWSGIGGWWRTTYWGFNDHELPLNGRVWYPKSNGKFPLVLIVHGDHPMQDYSDAGYEYLGELLASRGYIVVSVDQNFLNVLWSYTSGALFDENDARAILLLEHLRLWHEWNAEKESPFYNKVDTDNIALIGHSRGGEAVAHAALFNKLPHCPDDASVLFKYNYNIKSLVAIAAVDGQHKPSKKHTRLENINYLAMHGSYDGEVRSFVGVASI